MYTYLVSLIHDHSKRFTFRGKYHPFHSPINRNLNTHSNLLRSNTNSKIKKHNRHRSSSSTNQRVDWSDTISDVPTPNKITTDSTYTSYKPTSHTHYTSSPTNPQIQSAQAPKNQKVGNETHKKSTIPLPTIRTMPSLPQRPLGMQTLMIHSQLLHNFLHFLRSRFILER
ncbi:hypothetical protein JAAARDRAFT_513079 [Jaapia argillacea MUCL 33604]|uniref:Uncharacterized protein n=1 Tax=Jaapia argillacea MUCL 33604 TaxID=933084 RepID=A0A067Q5U1_9AGAM|nr:hypothetical protein JAAARDRAFT_513079 [Jaapia argillacea MUCL 33604]